jgi:phosphonate transport system permease protein
LLQVVITFAIAFLTTIFSAILSVVLGLLAARNLGGKRSSVLIKGFVALIRAIPTVMWVLIFAIVSGLGSVAAVIGISFHSLGYLTKMFSESFEEMDGGVIEALKATGASWWEIVFQGVLPTTIRSLVAWTFMRFEINYIVALGMGAAAGAGGIGFNLFMAGNFYYNMREVGAVTFLILLTCFLLEAVSVRIKQSLATK